MNQTQTRSGPNIGLLLLIPAAVIIAKGAMRRRAMREAVWSGPGGGRYGHHRFEGPDGGMGPRAFGLPPRIESALDAWHTRAHDLSGSTEPQPEPGAPTA